MSDRVRIYLFFDGFKLLIVNQRTKLWLRWEEVSSLEHLAARIIDWIAILIQL